MRIIWNQKNFNVRYKGTSTIVIIKTLYTLRKKKCINHSINALRKTISKRSTIIFQVRNFSKRIVTLLCLVKNSETTKEGESKLKETQRTTGRQQKI